MGLTQPLLCQCPYVFIEVVTFVASFLDNLCYVNDMCENLKTRPVVNLGVSDFLKP